MKTHLHHILSLALAVFAVVHAAPAAAQGQSPRPEVVQLVQAFIDTVNGTDSAADTFAKEHFTAEYQKTRTAEERRKWIQGIRAKYGKLTLQGLRREAPDTFIIAVSAEKGGQTEFRVTHDEKYKVSALVLNEAGGQ